MSAKLTGETGLHWVMLASVLLTFLLTLLAALFPGNGLHLLWAPVVMLPAQLTLVALVLIVSDRPPWWRFWHCGVYACGIYAALAIPPALASNRFGYRSLTTAHVGLIILTGYSLVLGGAYYANKVRLRCPQAVVAPALGPHQFRLNDLMKVVTLICLALGVPALVHERFLAQTALIG
jgi:hypothetical protein